MLARVLSSLLGFLMLNACASTLPTSVTRLGNDVSLSGGKYTSGGGLTLATEVREQAGKTLVCGAWAQSKQQSILTKGQAYKVLGSGAIYLGKEIAVRGLSFLPEVPPSESYADKEANCVLTERPWQAGDEAKTVQARFPRVIVYQDSDSGGTPVYFVPGEPEA